ncbi:MAG: hypothetical protein JXR68_12990 [Bacteroidales bacterium]|nr:hypothetical protein [Bacteroidales bacterium]
MELKKRIEIDLIEELESFPTSKLIELAIYLMDYDDVKENILTEYEYDFKLKYEDDIIDKAITDYEKENKQKEIVPIFFLTRKLSVFEGTNLAFGVHYRTDNQYICELDNSCLIEFMSFLNKKKNDIEIEIITYRDYLAIKKERLSKPYQKKHYNTSIK